MRAGANGLPMVGESARALGARPGLPKGDVPVEDGSSRNGRHEREPATTREPTELSPAT